MLTTLSELKSAALEEISAAQSLDTLFEVENKFFGKKGSINEILKKLKDLSGEEKKIIGPEVNKVKIEFLEAFNQKKLLLEKLQIEQQLKSEFFDTTIPAKSRQIGSIHPVYQVQRDVERIFGEMGFTVMDGPEVESEFYNFEGLNIPKDHPARDMQDTFFLHNKKTNEEQGSLVLRTHTSPVQIRTMLKYGAPLRLIVPGRVFRNEATDASHDYIFDQVEGILIDKEISLAHLKGILHEFLTRLFKSDVKVRFRPGYFPFVEPGLEVDFHCKLWEGKNRNTSKNTDWLEFLGAGMIHPNVLRAGGINPAEYQGWAFGFGLSRLTLMKYGIDDIRLLTSGDLRFLKQF